MNQRWITHKSPVPHPFAFFLANGWDTTTLNRPVHQEQPDSPQRVTPRDEPAPDHPQKPRAPSIRLFSGEWVGYDDTQPARSSGSSLTRQRCELRPEMNQRRITHKSPVPHPFAFFLANGWDTTTLNRPVHQEQLDSPRRVTPRDEPAPDHPQKPRAPSIRLFLANGWDTTTLNRPVHQERSLAAQLAPSAVEGSALKISLEPAYYPTQRTVIPTERSDEGSAVAFS